MYIDTHAHLSDEKFDPDRPEVLERLRAARVSTVIEIAEEEKQWPKAEKLAESPGFYWTAGFHPYYASQADPGLEQRLAAALKHPKCVGVGEVGLDYHRPDAQREDQKRLLAALLKVAAEAGRPVVLHCREARVEESAAQGDLLTVLAPHPKPADGGPTGVAHCFQGGAETAWKLIERGFLLGVDAPITYPNSYTLRALLTHVPLECLVLETDSPYLPPQTHRGQRNEPAHLPAVARALAEIRHISVEKIAETTSANARRLFRLPVP